MANCDKPTEPYGPSILPTVAKWLAIEDAINAARWRHFALCTPESPEERMRRLLEHTE